MEESRSRRAQPYTVLSDDTAYVGREDASSRSSVDVGLEKKPVHALGPQLSWKSYVADVVGILFSLFFTLLAILIILLESRIAPSRDTISSGVIVVEIAQSAATIWPVAFAAVVGRAIKSIADRNAERGAKLGKLEQLFGSQTLGGTVRSIFLFQRYDLWTLVLVIAWTFSPLGSQAFIRSYRVADRIGFNKFNVTVPDFGKISEVSELRRTSDTYRNNLVVTTYLDQLRTVGARNQYTENAESSSYDGVSVGFHADSYGNPRIPRPSDLERSESSDSEGWFQVPENRSVNFMSLIGVPVGAYDGIGNFSFTVSTNYTEVSNCKEWEQYPLDESGDWIRSNFKRLTYLDEAEHVILQNGEGLDEEELLSQNSPMETLFPLGYSPIFIDVASETDDLETSGKRSTPRIMFASNSFKSYSAIVTECDVSASHVEAEISCRADHSFRQNNGPSCRAVRVRDATDPELPPEQDYTMFNLPGGYGRQIAKQLVNYFPTSPNFSNPSQWLTLRPYPIVDYLIEPGQYMVQNLELSSQFVVDPSQDQIEVNQVDIEIFAKRFSILLNTFYHSTILPEITRKDVTFADERIDDAVRFGMGIVSETDDRYANLGIANITKNMTVDSQYFAPPRYELVIHWLVFLFIGVLIMVASSITSCVLRRKNKAPEVLGFVNSAVRYNENFRFSDINSSTDGAELAKQLQDEMVKIGDVQEDREVGKIALTRAAEARPVKRSKLYE